MIDINNPFCPLCNNKFIYANEIFSNTSTAHIQCVGHNSPNCPAQFIIYKQSVIEMNAQLTQDIFASVNFNNDLNCLRLYKNSGRNLHKSIYFNSLTELKSLLNKYLLFK